MTKLYNDTMQGLEEVVKISRGEIHLKEKNNMSAPTFTADDDADKLKLNTHNK